MPVDPNASIRISAFNWVPPFARGHVRDLRPRWAFEEAGISYAVRKLDSTTGRPAEYYQEQPFGQVPSYHDEVVSLFESGAIVLHIGRNCDTLLPRDPAARARTRAGRVARGRPTVVGTIVRPRTAKSSVVVSEFVVSPQRCRMNILSRLFSRGRQSSVQRTTASRPLRIANPAIGFLNHAGAAGASLSQADQRVLSPLFKVSKTSEDLPPRCDVLFLYRNINPEESTSTPAIRELIKSAGAYVAVIASENSADAYIESVGRRTDWSANIAMVVNRKDDKLSLFFYRLFAEMFKGRSMLIVWAELAPQMPGSSHSDVPDSIMAAEAGHITFQ
jgi:hypothetical protein